MKVKLISYSKPTDSISDEGIDNAQELVAFCARVSNPSNQKISCDFLVGAQRTMGLGIQRHQNPIPSHQNPIKVINWTRWAGCKMIWI